MTKKYDQIKLKNEDRSWQYRKIGKGKHQREDIKSKTGTERYSQRER